MVLSAGTSVDDILLRRGDDEKLMSLPGGPINHDSMKAAIDRLRGAGAVLVGGGNKKKPGGGPQQQRRLIAAYDGAKPQERYGMILARASELPQPSPETHFLRTFGQSDRLIADTGTTDGSVPQALALMNGGVGKLVSEPASAAVTAAALEKTTEGQIGSLYLSFLARRPLPEEAAAAQKALSGGLAPADLAWALANTREFLFIR
jgi:hypothetical protein